MKSVYFCTLGCKVNQYESQAMSEALEQNGFVISNENDKADIIVVNSCTVTGESDRKTRQAVRRFRKLNPNSLIVLTGCMTQANPETFNILPEADIVLGNNSNEKLLKKINEFYIEKKREVDIIEHHTGDIFKKCSISGFNERERAFIKIEDGCDRFCSYCIIPFARGRVRSKSLKDIKSEIEIISKNGYKEVVLVGINLSAFGKDTGYSITDAIKIANDTPGIERVRLGSLEPDHMTDEIIDKLKTFDKFCPQFHLSLQSGSNNTLKRMNRHYTKEEYQSLCKKLRSAFKDCTITTDVMVGFPLETEEDFEESVEFCEKIGFEKVHVFPYSVREGTKAQKLEQIEKSIKEKRAKIMIERTDKIREYFFKNQVGKEFEVLVESAKKDNFNIGYTKNYIPVCFKCEKEDVAKLIKIKITGYDKENCYGTKI